MTLADIWNWAGENKAILSLWGLAVAVTMPEKPPPPLDRWAFFVFWWSWFHETVHAFISFRSPQNTQTSLTTQVTPTSSLQVSESSGTTAPVPADKMKASNEGAKPDALPHEERS